MCPTRPSIGGGGAYIARMDNLIELQAVLALLCVWMVAAALNVGLLRYFFDITQPGMILGWWLPVLARIFVKADDSTTEWLATCQTRAERDTIWYDAATRSSFLKPLGGCDRCTLPWLTIATFWAATLVITPEPHILVCFAVYFLASLFWFYYLPR